ncbi:hypothetical protein PsYK624_117930 [Phanerochaete sordida]|uniref:Uncharacterized protein n=1 Tax=Phanerochaete sordida TaxID=48140 RepID=A0A9P3LIW5_9APHY|nr:hypothetical protein PsYK624_117930 [Phanerochaete sordida]
MPLDPKGWQQCRVLGIAFRVTPIFDACVSPVSAHIAPAAVPETCKDQFPTNSRRAFSSAYTHSQARHHDRARVRGQLARATPSTPSMLPRSAFMRLETTYAAAPRDQMGQLPNISRSLIVQYLNRDTRWTTRRYYVIRGNCIT